MLATYRKWNN